MNCGHLEYKEFLNMLPQIIAIDELERKWADAVKNLKGKIIVLDDDPTGTQTVHSVPVYTSWHKDILKLMMEDECKVAYILTNSRALTSEETEKLHRNLARELKQVSVEAGKEFVLVSRCDSTLRGHYPLETSVLYEELNDASKIDGEIIVPFFFEGGRITFKDVHYVREGDALIPVGQTEFAKDSTFGYKSSDLKEWIEERTCKQYLASDVISISLDMLRGNKIDEITNILMNVKNFNKVIVNAVECRDLKVFIIALVQAMNNQKRFIFRSAASLVQVIGGITTKPLLTNDDLYPAGSQSGPGLIVAGSYVQKTTKQLEKLKELSGMTWIEMNVKKAENKESLKAEVSRVIEEVEGAFKEGKDACVYTSREYHRSHSKGIPSEENLVFSSRVSEGLVQIVSGIKIKPGFLVSKGGITSSDIGVKGLGVKCAEVLGQIQPGVPVWRLGTESRFPGLPYIIFPGNVGAEDTLKTVVEILRKRGN